MAQIAHNFLCTAALVECRVARGDERAIRIEKAIEILFLGKMIGVDEMQQTEKVLVM